MKKVHWFYLLAIFKKDILKKNVQTLLFMPWCLLFVFKQEDSYKKARSK